MRSLHITLIAFCQLLLASFILYSTITSASPVGQPISGEKLAPGGKQQQQAAKQEAPKVAVAEKESAIIGRHAAAAPKEAERAPIKHQVVAVAEQPVKAKSAAQEKPAKQPQEADKQQVGPRVAPVESVKVAPVQAQAAITAVKEQVLPVTAALAEQTVQHKTKTESSPSVQQSPPAQQVSSEPKVAANTSAKLVAAPVEQPIVRPDLRYGLLLRYLPDAVAGETDPVVGIAQQQVENKIQHQAPIMEQSVAKSAPADDGQLAAIGGKSAVPVNAEITSGQPVVRGGLGPLHLLAATLCNYQPDKPTADETLNSLYTQRAAVRKSLFEFMSLKFTNLEKLSSHLNSGLEVVPPKPADPSSQSVLPSHGWPVVGKCTAHDLRLMAEAAWCEYDSSAARRQPIVSSQAEVGEQIPPRITSNQHRVNNRKRSVEQQSPVVILSSSSSAAAAAADQSSVISKILHVNDVKDAPVVESNINITQQLLELASITAQQQPSSSVECRRKALRLTKSLFNHLAENQKLVSESWPELYVQLESDDCARKRMIDVVKTLSAFRGESSSAIRRDNVEFAFAMDDLRSKVLDKEVNVPLSVDKQFIEVEQFLQQSVKLMLANIDPERAKLTSMRYRSLMAGPSSSADDQCIELHQRLLAKNYPTDCNPNQFGQLPDVLRMTASSLELWSIEKELAKRSSKITDYLLSPSVSATVQCKRDVDACIANLVAS